LSEPSAGAATSNSRRGEARFNDGKPTTAVHMR
jgi:hypothetical protein